MKLEIERKFLLKTPLPDLVNGKTIIQSYIFVSERKAMRVRIVDNICQINIKISKDELTRDEFEYEIPMSEGLKLIELGCTHSPIEKLRYLVNYENMVWEIDVFKGDNEGLVIAEIELESATQHFIKPPWIGEEVTYDKKYCNSYLYENPYKTWKY
jgi:adenylate cyclase